MDGKIWKHAVCGLILVSLVLVSRATATKLGFPGTVVLLRNGHVLRGSVTQVGDLYYVALPNGEIRLKVDQVEFVCRDLEEGYLQKRAAIKPGDADGHLHMTHWCLRHHLLDHAADELLNAAEINPTHPAIEVLRRRLTLAVEPPPKRAPSTKPAESGPSFAELDAIARKMPPGTLERFTQTIQPTLVNNCATAGCHGPQPKAKYQLLRTTSGRLPSRRTTQKNLFATMQWIDRGNPISSRLLTVPIEPHGAAQKPVFTQRQLHQYKQIVDWVRSVSDTPDMQVPATVAGASQGSVQAMAGGQMLGEIGSSAPPKLLPPEALKGRPLAAEAGPVSKVTPASYLESIVEEDGSSPQAINPPNPFGPAAIPPKEPDPFKLLRSKVQRGAKIKQFTPVDPFDPAIFNRKFFGVPKDETPASGNLPPSP